MFRGKREDSSGKQDQVRNMHGVTYGCFYMIAFVLILGVLAAVLIPLLVRKKEANAIAFMIGQASLFLAIPVGIFGFLRHRKRRN